MKSGCQKSAISIDPAILKHPLRWMTDMAVSDLILISTIDQAWEETFTPLIRTLYEDLMNHKQTRITHQHTMDAYTKCFNILTKKHVADAVYQRFAYHHERIMKEIVAGFILDGSVLPAFVQYWDVYQIMTKWFKMFFYYLYKVTQPFPFLDHFCQEFFHSHYSIVFHKMIDVYHERRAVEYPLCARIIDALRSLVEHHPFYLTEFEKMLITVNGFFYRGQSTATFQQHHAGGVYEYILAVQNFMYMECHIVRAFHMDSIWSHIRAKIVHHFILPHMSWILTAFEDMLRSDDWAKIRTIYDMLRFDHAERLRATYEMFVRAEFTSLSANFSIDDLRGLMKKHERLIDHVLNSSFDASLRECLREHVNVAGWIDRFVRGVDAFLTRPGKLVVEDCIEILDVLAFVADKERFRDVYRDRMAVRLVDNRSPPAVEARLLDRMEMHLGASCIFPLRTMLWDVKESMQISDCTRVTVVSQYQWGVRAEDVHHLNYPAAIAKDFARFDSMFATMYGTDKRIVHASHLGRVQLRAHFPGDRRYIIAMTPIQALILLALTESPCSTTTEIALKVLSAAHPSDDGFIGAVLVSLKDLVTRHDSTGTWSINACFSCVKKHVQLPIPKWARTPKDAGQRADGVILEHGFIIDSVIVRILKHHRVLTHDDLVTRVRKTVKLFQPEMKFIKQRIENLIERDYLERHDPTTYAYVP